MPAQRSSHFDVPCME